MFAWLKRLMTPSTPAADKSASSTADATGLAASSDAPQVAAPEVYGRVLLEGLEESERALAERVLEDARKGDIELPTLPDLAIAVGKAVRDPDASIDQLARLIQVDMLMAAKVVQVANSAVFGGYSQVSTLQQAITRLGLKNTRDIVTTLAMKQLFTADRPDLERRMRQLWQASTEVAAISAVLSRFAEGIDAERAMLAGLMHDVGVLTIIQYVANDDKDAYTDAEIASAITHLRGLLGNMVLKHWNFEQELAQVPMCLAAMDEHIPGPITYCDVVRVAKLHSLFGKPELADYPPLSELSAFKKFGLDATGADKSIAALREAKADIDAVLSTLNI